MRGKLLLVSLLVILTMIFAGCSPAEPAESGETEEPVAEAPETVEEPAEEPAEEPEAVEEKQEVKIATLKGPTGMGMAQLMENDEAGTSQLDYTFELVGAPDQIVGQVVQGKVDIAAVPSNMASILYNKTEGKVQFLAVNTLGVLFVLENGETIESISDLEGKTIVSSGKGATPEFLINYILQENGLSESVTVEYAVEHAEAAAKLNTGDAELALLPQPFVTSSMLANENARIAIDLTDEWATLTDGMALPMGGIIVNKAFAEANPEVIATFMEEYTASVDFVNNDPAAAGQLIEKFGILPKAALATKAIPNCNIVLIDAQEAKEPVMKFYEVLFGFEPTSIGGKIPSEDFFYNK